MVTERKSKSTVIEKYTFRKVIANAAIVINI